MKKNPKTGYNWRLLKPNKLGYIILENWSNFNQIKGNQRGVCSEKPIIWE